METDQFQILETLLNNSAKQLSEIIVSQSNSQKEQNDTLKRIEGILKELVGIHRISDKAIGLKQIQESLKTISDQQ